MPVETAYMEEECADLSSLSRTTLVLKPCKHQVAGHLPENGKMGSLVDGFGRFYKPLQPGCRGKNELSFYLRISSEKFLQQHDDDEETWSLRAKLLRFVPRFYGSINTEERQYLMLEDLVHNYEHPCVMDIKIGYRTWYSSGSESYNHRARLKDENTTQSSIGFKICGWQVYDVTKRKYHRVSKSSCKKMTQPQVRDALISFADNKSGAIGPRALYSGCNGVLSRLRELRNWFQSQSMFKFYSSSVLMIYEGGVEDSGGDLNVSVRLVDFAHTFPTEGVKDRNFQEGLSSFMEWLIGIAEESSIGYSVSR